MGAGKDAVGRRANLIGKRNKHKGVSRPDMKVVRVEQKGRISAGYGRRARRHLEFDIFVRDVFLRVVHPVGAAEGLDQVSTVPGGPKRAQRGLGISREEIGQTHRTARIS